MFNNAEVDKENSLMASIMMSITHSPTPFSYEVIENNPVEIHGGRLISFYTSDHILDQDDILFCCFLSLVWKLGLEEVLQGFDVEGLSNLIIDKYGDDYTMLVGAQNLKTFNFAQEINNSGSDQPITPASHASPTALRSLLTIYKTIYKQMINSESHNVLRATELVEFIKFEDQIIDLYDILNQRQILLDDGDEIMFRVRNNHRQAQKSGEIAMSTTVNDYIRHHFA